MSMLKCHGVVTEDCQEVVQQLRWARLMAEQSVGVV